MNSTFTKKTALTIILTASGKDSIISHSKVDNLDEALEEAQKLGYPSILKMKSNGGRRAYIEDPNGIWIELF